MRDILDPADVWLGTPGGAVVFGNKRPIALDDDLTVLKDSGPVTIDVLANDTDPEGGILSLMSASAALGTAVAETNNTVTYTPPAGLSGFDTVFYEIADDRDQRRTAQINVTIIEPQLSVSAAPGNTLIVNAGTGLIDITVATPPEFAGTYQVNTADLSGGPINLAPPALSGIVLEGQALSAAGGLWINDIAAGTPVRSWQWRRSGADVPGETGTTYTVVASDSAQTVSVSETLSDAFGQRSAIGMLTAPDFVPSDDPLLIGWWDAGDAPTIATDAGGALIWTDKAGGTPLTGVADPASGIRTLNGLNVIDCAGGAYLEAPRSLPASGDVAFHMVLEVDSVGNAFEAALAVDAVNDFQIDANGVTQFNGRLNAAGVGSSVDLSGGPFWGALILSVVFDRTGSATAEVFVTGTSRGTMGYTLPIDAAVTLHLMTNRTKNAWLNGAVAEMMVTGDVANRTAYHGYLATKWGLA